MNRLLVSTAPYLGFSLPETLASIERIGEKNVEFVADHLLTEDKLEASAEYVREAFAATTLCCGSVAITNDAAKRINPPLLSSLLDFCQTVGASVLVLPAVSKKALPSLLSDVQAVCGKKKPKTRILLENRGDQIDNVASFDAEMERVVALLEERELGFAYNPANLFSHQPGIDLLRDAHTAVKNASYIVAQDMVIKDRHYYSVPVGEGLCRYDELLERFSLIFDERILAVRIPYGRYRNRHGDMLNEPVSLLISDIEQQLSQSIANIRKNISQSILRI